MSHAVSELITSTILKLQQLPALKDFYLAGGTSLALRLNHRKSDDIDLFTNKIFGTEGLNKITEELISFYHPKEITINHINKDLDGQYQFLRAYIFEDGQTIKVELLQNLQIVEPIETLNNIRLCSLEDLGIFKLYSATSRGANKDIYDLDYITDTIPLPKLLEYFTSKQVKFTDKKFESIFDLDAKPYILENPNLLLDITENSTTSKNRPFHSKYRIDIIEGNKAWQAARMSWRLKVKSYLKSL